MRTLKETIGQIVSGVYHDKETAIINLAAKCGLVEIDTDAIVGISQGGFRGRVPHGRFYIFNLVRAGILIELPLRHPADTQYYRLVEGHPALIIAAFGDTQMRTFRKLKKTAKQTGEVVVYRPPLMPGGWEWDMTLENSDWIYHPTMLRGRTILFDPRKEK